MPTGPARDRHDRPPRASPRRAAQAPAGEAPDTRERFTAALDALVSELQADRSILAAILCGSLSHDTVWQRSDIDLALVTVDDHKAPATDAALVVNDVNVHAFLLPRAEFRRTVEGSARNSFMHSLLAKGRLLYTHDPTIRDLCDSLESIGQRDTDIQLLRAAAGVVPAFDKARKWLLTRGDLNYTAVWILYCANGLAQLEVIGRRLLADREVLPQALILNPALFTPIYTDLLNAPKTAASVGTALEIIDRHLADHATIWFAPLIAYLREAGEARSSSEIENHFKRTLDVSGMTTACEYLAHQGVIGKASTPLQLTKRSNIVVQELAFYDLTPMSDAAQDW